jgi:hypothetical protein
MHCRNPGTPSLRDAAIVCQTRQFPTHGSPMQKQRVPGARPCSRTERSAAAHPSPSHQPRTPLSEGPGRDVQGTARDGQGQGLRPGSSRHQPMPAVVGGDVARACDDRGYCQEDLSAPASASGRNLQKHARETRRDEPDNLPAHITGFPDPVRHATNQSSSLLLVLPTARSARPVRFLPAPGARLGQPTRPRPFARDLSWI